MNSLEEFTAIFTIIRAALDRPRSHTVRPYFAS